MQTNIGDVSLQVISYINDFACLIPSEGRRCPEPPVRLQMLYAVAAGSVGAVCETDDGTLLMLPGARLLHVPRPMATVLAWLDGRRPG